MSRDATALVTGILLAAVITPLSGQQPTFRSGVDLVTVDATVLSGDGHPIDSLGPDDFQIKVDGRPRRVVSAQFVSQAARSTRPSRPAAAHFTSNEDADAGRVVIVAVDQAHIRRLEGRPALQAADAFIERLDPSDRVAVIGLARLGSLALTRDRVDLTQRLAALAGQADPVSHQFNVGLSEALEIAEGSRTRLADAVLRECGRALTDYVNLARAADDAAGGRDACPEQVEQEARATAQHAHIQARISLSALEALVASLKDLPGPKTVIVLSEGMVADPRRVDVMKLAAEAQAARVTIYALHLEVPAFEAAQDRVSPTFVRDIQVLGDGLARVAGAARGTVFRLAGSDPKPFDRIARELSGYYLLAFAPLDAERDGRSHRIQVALARGRGDVRARTGFTLPVAPTSAPTRDARLAAVLRAAAPSTELPVRVSTYTYAEPDSARLRVVVSAETGSGERAPSSALLGFVVIDARGVIAATAGHESPTGRYAFSATVPGGDYTLRVGALDSFGRQGSVERPFAARLIESGGVRISDLMLAPLPARPRDPLEPLVDRVSPGNVIAYLEMLAAAREQLPNLVRIVVVPEDGGDSLVAVTADLTAPGAARSLEKGIATGALSIARAVLPTATLRPGRYVARAEVLFGDTVVTRVARPFSIPD
ncbi:MAG: VWA domain-containing protein [Vicinamibacterales bacterium]|jgi:VWFA-related protein